MRFGTNMTTWSRMSASSPTAAGLISGSASVDDTAEELGIKEDDDIDAVAIGGLVQEKLSRLPKVGDKFIWGDFDGTVTRATNRRVQEVRLTPRKVQDESEK